MFRFLRRTNLRSTKRRSASCPNLEHVTLEDSIQENSIQDNNAFKSSSDSDSSEDDSANKFERLKAQKSVRIGRLKEKEKKENTKKNLICMNDYLGKLSELKTWLKEERKKDVDCMRSPKLKAHFKTFVKLWNKRKLPLKYYRGCAIDMYIEDSASSLSYSDTAKQPINPPYSIVDNAAKYSTILPPPFDLSCEKTLEDIGSPFSTFGKSGDLASPATLTEQVLNATPFGKNKEENSSQKQSKYPWIPATSRLNTFTAQPWTSGVDLRSNPVLRTKNLYPQGHFATSSYSSSPSASITSPSNFTSGEQKCNIEEEQQAHCKEKSSGPSPVYSSIIDAIPYSTGSPKYAEIDEITVTPSHKQSSSGYCSLSPLQKMTTPYTSLKPAVSKKQSLNRRRSKSMEYLYSVPFKAESFEHFKHVLVKEDMELSETPPIPARKYSPVSLFSSYSDHKDDKTTPLKDYSNSHNFSSLKTTLSPLSSSPENSSQKRRSQESIESASNSTSSLKKAKSNLLSNTDSCKLDDSLMSNTYGNEDTSPSLSILTGSLNPTTRSKYKLNESLKSSENIQFLEARLSILEIKQLEESPKLSRRRLKRRSSSFSTTPGKGLIFGKTSKLLSASSKRVSFAKNVKETENNTTPMKSSSTRRSAVPQFTKQTQERKQFETFLLSHESPPKKSNSPNKVPSPDKNSTVKTISPTRQNITYKYMSVNGTPISRVNPESQENIPRKNFLVSVENEENSYSKLSTNSLLDTRGYQLFPTSSSRQLGRRVLGPPNASPNKTMNVQGFSSKTNLGDTSLVICPQKNLPTLYQVISPERNSENTKNNFSPNKILGVSSRLDSPSKLVESPDYLASPLKKSGTTSQLVSPCKNMTSDLTSLQKSARTMSSNLPSQNYVKAVSSQGYLTLHPKSDSQPKDLTGKVKPQSPTNKLFEQPTSTFTTKKSTLSLVSKLTEKAATICAQELSESDDCLSSDEVLCVAPLSNTSEILNEKTSCLSNSSDTYFPSQKLPQESEDFEITLLETSPGSKTKETVNCTMRPSITSSSEVFLSKETVSDSHHTSPILANMDQPCTSHNFMKESSLESVEESTIQSTNKTQVYYSAQVNKEKSNSISSDELTNKTLNSLSSGYEMDRYHERGTKTMQSFHLPVIDLASEYKNKSIKISSQNKISNINVITSSCNSNIECFYDNSSTKILEDRQTCYAATPLKVDSLHTTAPLKVDSLHKATSLKVDSLHKATSLKVVSSGKKTPLKVDSCGKAAPLKSDSPGKAASLKSDSPGKAASLKSDLLGKTASLKSDSLGKAASLKSDSLDKTASLKSDSPGKAASLKSDSPGKAASLKSDSPGKAASLKSDSPGKAASPKSDSPGKAASLKSDSPGKTASLKSDSLGKTASLKSDLPSKAASLKSDSPGKTASLKSDSPGKTASLKSDSPGKAASLKSDSLGKTASLKSDSLGKTASLKSDLPSKAASLKSDSPGKTASLKSDSPGKTASLKSDSPGKAASLKSDSLGKAASLKSDSLGKTASLNVYSCHKAILLKLDAPDKTTHLKIDSPDNNSQDGISKQLYSSADNHESIKYVCEDKNEGLCDLKRLSSIRASPKIIDNDGWITERRISSKGKSLQSFRSAHNRYLLKSSSKDENELEVDHLSQEISGHLAPAFVDTNVKQNACGKTKDIVVDTPCQSSNETLSKNSMPLKTYESSYKTDQAYINSTDKISAAIPAKAKPPILPKPSKASLLANQKLYPTNILVNKTISKRRSSLAREQSTLTTSSKISNENKKSSGRISTGKEKSTRRISNGKYKSRARKSNEQSKCIESQEQEKSGRQDLNVIMQDSMQNIPCVDSSKLTSHSKDGPKSRQTTRKSSILANSGKSSTVAERKKFFCQLDMNTNTVVNKPRDTAFGISYQGKFSPQRPYRPLVSMTSSINEVDSKLQSPQKSMLLAKRQHIVSP